VNKPTMPPNGGTIGESMLKRSSYIVDTEGGRCQETRQGLLGDPFQPPYSMGREGQGSPCPASLPDPREVSPLVAAVMAVGGVIVLPPIEFDPYSKAAQITKAVFPELARGQRMKRRLPQGHRFYPDCEREQEARMCEWLVRIHKGDCWFLTLTFKDYVSSFLAWGLHDRLLSRLNQSYKQFSGAALLSSITSVEWQQREVIHFHLLIFGRQLGLLSRKRWENCWRSMSGGFSACYDAKPKAAPYLAKHGIKDRLDSNLHYGGSWRGITTPRSVARCCFKGALALTPNSSVL